MFEIFRARTGRELAANRQAPPARPPRLLSRLLPSALPRSENKRPASLQAVDGIGRVGAQTSPDAMVSDFLTSLENRTQGGSPPVASVTVRQRRPAADRAPGVRIRRHPAATAHRSVVDRFPTFTTAYSDRWMCPPALPLDRHLLFALVIAR